MLRTSPAVRALTRARQPLTLYRPQIRRYADHHMHQQVHQQIQPVTFVSPRYTTRRLLLWAVKSAAAIVVLQAAFNSVFSIEYKETEEREAGATRSEEFHDHETDEDGDVILDEDNVFFLPLGRTTQLPKTYYRGSDPEWQDFRRLSGDPKKLMEIRKSLVLLTRTRISKDPRCQSIGTVDLEKGKFWLDIVFPDGPPPEYEQSGLAFASTYIGWAQRTISQEEYLKRRRIFMPIGMLQASYASLVTMYHHQLRRLRLALGDPSDQPDPSSMRGPNGGKPRANIGFGGVVDGPHPRPDAPRAGPGGLPGAMHPDASSPSGDHRGGGGPVPDNLPGPLHFPGDQPTVTPIFRRAMYAASVKDGEELVAPRGTLIVTGLVETVGTKGRSTVDATAFYDPRSERFVVFMGRVRTMMPFRQGPKGGD